MFGYDDTMVSTEKTQHLQGLAWAIEDEMPQETIDRIIELARRWGATDAEIAAAGA